MSIREVKLDSILAKKTSTQLKIFIVLVGADTLAKVVAFWFLPAGKPILPGAFFQFALRINSVGLGSSAQEIISISHDYNYSVVAYIFCFCLGILLLMLSHWGKLSVSMVAICVGASFLVALAGGYILPSANIANVQSPIITLRISQCFLWITIWILVSAPLWKLGALLWASAATGNLLSFLYPPYNVVDFMWSAPINRVTGFGIFNLADILWLIAFPIYAAAALQSIMLKFKVQANAPTENKT